MTDSAPAGCWIAADLNDSGLTAWLMQGSKAVQTAIGPAGIGEVADLLAAQARNWGLPDGTAAFVSGSAAAELKPVPVAATAPPALETNGSPALNLHLLPGLRQTAPTGVMRSAPVRVAGFLSQRPNWDGVICLPGATTHWVLVSADEIVSFQSFATVTLARAAETSFAIPDTDSPDLTQMADSLSDLISRPERLAARLAEVRASCELKEMSPTAAKGRLWGCWLGAELAAARAYWLGQNLALIADTELAPPYAAALQSQGLAPEVCSAEAMALAGLIAGRQALTR